MTTIRVARIGWLVLLAIAVQALAIGSARAADTKTLAQQVQIRRTQYGVPHIQGETFEAAAFGFGYCQAEDHLANIMRGVLGARGELALAFGPDKDNKNVEADFSSRQFRIYARALDSYHKLDPDYRSMLEGFAAGLNFYVDRHRDLAPAWVPRVTGHDIAAYGVAGIMRFAFNRSDILKDFLKSQGAQSAMLDDNSDVADVGSNMWAFAPSRSQSGRAILMGNPHQPWAPVSTYYEAHMIVPGKLNFYGSTFIGRPIITSGWNEYLGWSHTVNNPDLEEIYELDLDPDRPDHYLFDGGSVPLARDDVTVKIKSSGAPNSQTRTFWHTPLGPVVHRAGTKVFVLRSACYENYRAYEQWLRMTQAKSYAEFRGTLEMTALPMFNICYADRVGNIFYLWNGTVPNLPHPAHKSEAVHAARSSEIWTRFHAISELPQLFNPPGGYVQNCNSPPYLTNLLAPLDPAKYPAHFSPNDLSLRTQHSLRLVNNDKKLTLEEVCELKHSPLMLLAERVKGDLIAALRATQPNSEVEVAIRALENWDNTVSAESQGGTLFAEWWERYFEKGVGKFAVAWNAAEPMTTPRGLADKARAVKTFLEALEEVTSRYGRPDVAWGEAHRIRKGSIDLPVRGGSGVMGCFRVLEFHKDDDGKLAANSGDSWVFAVEFSQPPKAYTVVAYSASDVAGSAHFSDQAALFSANKMKRAAFTEAEIQAQLLKSYRPGEE
ncbi:MAG: penicillin acylase family protein [Planctomycetia bacterium]|nr:penicillin acylase family protein [Planctomycetia bacterium]